MPSFVPNPSELQGATLGNVATNQTVQGQMAGIMDSGNPLLARAKTKAAQAANKRGLLNSSMGVQAGQEAMLTAALPMAQFDATQFSNQARQNQDWQNKFGLESNAYQYQTGLKEQDYQQQLGTGAYGGTGLIGAQTSAASQLQAEKSVQQLAAQTQAEQSQVGLQSAELGFKSTEGAAQRGHEAGLQSSQQTFQAGESALGRGQQTSMQEAEITAQRERLASEIASRESLAGRQITHEAALAEADRILKGQLQTQSEAFQSSESALGRGQQTEMQRSEIEARKEQLASEIASREGISAAEIKSRMDLQAEQLTAEESRYLAEIASREGVSAAELANRLSLATAEITSREKLAGNQITHEAALAQAKNSLDVALQSERIASQEGISEAELENRLVVAREQITASEKEYLAQISSREGISEAELANRLALNAADITSREKLAGNQITHEAALSHAKNSLDAALQAERLSMQQELQTQTEAHQVGLQTQAESFKASMADLDFYHKGQLISAEEKERRLTIGAELHQRLWNAQQLENLSASNKEKLALLDKDMKLAIQGSASASQILTQAMDAIGEISANKELDQAALDKRIGSVISHANANIALIQNWSNTEGGSFVDTAVKAGGKPYLDKIVDPIRPTSPPIINNLDLVNLYPADPMINIKEIR